MESLRTLLQQDSETARLVREALERFEDPVAAAAIVGVSQLVMTNAYRTLPVSRGSSIQMLLPLVTAAAAAWAGAAARPTSIPAPKAPAATAASERLPKRIALDNAFPFVNACPLFGPPGAEGSISEIPGRNERQAR